MADKDYKKRVSSLITKAKKKGLITKYDEFIKTDISKETALNEDEVAYYTSKNKGAEKQD